MSCLPASRYEEDLIKNEGARVLTRLYDVFSNAQGQLTPKSAAEFYQIRINPSFYNCSCYLQE